MKSNGKNNTIVAAAVTLLCCKLANRWEFLEKEKPKMNTQSCGDEQSAPIGLLKPTFDVLVTISVKKMRSIVQLFCFQDQSDSFVCCWTGLIIILYSYC